MVGTLRVALLLGAFAALGCGPTLGVRAQLAQRTRDLHPCYAHRVLQLTENAFEVTGCDMTVEYTDVAPGNRRRFELMRPAAALARAELQCDYEGLTIVGDRAPTRRSFTGCGASASYVLACQPVGGCRWSREGPVLVAAPAPVAAEPVGLDTPIPPPPTDTLPPPPAVLAPSPTASSPATPPPGAAP